MANPNTPYGLRPYSQMSGQHYNGNNTALYLDLGDPVMLITNYSDVTSQLVAGVERRLAAAGPAKHRRRRAAGAASAESSIITQ